MYPLSRFHGGHTLAMAGIMLATLLCPFKAGEIILLERPHCFPSSKNKDGSNPTLFDIHGNWFLA